MAYEAELTFATDLAKAAGEIMRHYFRSDQLETTWKADDSPVTKADTDINQLVIDRVKEAYPDYGILGEEQSFEEQRQFVWVVDPVDGTVPFSVGIPASTFLLALVDKRDGQPVVAVCYDPFLDELYTATKGGGAFLNGQPLRVPEAMRLERSYVTVYGPKMQLPTRTYDPNALIAKLGAMHVRNFKLSSGAYTGVKIARGQFATFIMGNGKPWDSAAPALIIQEAGGVTSDLEGNPRRFDETGLGCIMSANAAIHEQLLEMIRAI